jgi:hypothetical protein
LQVYRENLPNKYMVMNSEQRTKRKGNLYRKGE